MGIFREEVIQRATNLVQGAIAMESGQFNLEDSSDLFRDAHTIKGSSRVMGFVAMGEAGRVLEATWRDVSEGILKPSPELGELLGAVSAEFEAAIDAGVEGHPAGLNAAVEALERLLGEPRAAEGAAPSAPAPAPAPSAPGARIPPPAPLAQ
ncbi:MAG: Hpt domain-containing protein, partial [Acidimicrobiia bacterium]|nr:Hpt domain-containing protein [Acidimicrobiia bacterium]